jgi:glycine cleavage system H protein
MSRRISSYEIREGLLYTKEHEWLRMKGDKAYVGITDYAAKELTDIVYVSLPKPGESFKKGQAMATLESVKAVGEVYAPISGLVLEVNANLSSRPELINNSPYDEGWIVALKPSEGHEKELAQLLSAESYAAHLEALLKERRKA